MLGVVLGLVSALGFGVSPIFARLALRHMRPTTGTIASLLVGSAITMGLAFAIYTEEILALVGVRVLVRPAPMGDPPAFLWFALYGVVTFVLARLLNYTSVGLAGVSRAVPIVGSNPLFATVMAITITGESINNLIWMGTFFIIGGLTLILAQR